MADPKSNALDWSTPGTRHFDQTDDRLIEASTASYDNFHVRVLAGSTAFSLPAGGVNRTHLELAKRRLAKFSAVLILEDGKQYARGCRVDESRGANDGQVQPARAPHLFRCVVRSVRSPR